MYSLSATMLRTMGLTVGEATLRIPQDGETTTRSPTRGTTRASGGRAAYLSGFRIVQDAMQTRHAEYRIVLLDARYERWHRFSEVKTLTKLLRHLPPGSAADGAREAWQAVRACKAPQGHALDVERLSRKCVAIERFISLLLEAVPADVVKNLLLQVSASPRVGGAWGVRRGHEAYLTPGHHSARTSAPRQRMR